MRRSGMAGKGDRSRVAGTRAARASQGPSPTAASARAAGARQRRQAAHQAHGRWGLRRCSSSGLRRAVAVTDPKCACGDGAELAPRARVASDQATHVSKGGRLMRSVLLTAYGDVDKLEVRDVPE